MATKKRRIPAREPVSVDAQLVAGLRDAMADMRRELRGGGMQADIDRILAKKARDAAAREGG